MIKLNNKTQLINTELKSAILLNKRILDLWNNKASKEELSAYIKSAMMLYKSLFRHLKLNYE